MSLLTTQSILAFALAVAVAAGALGGCARQDERPQATAAAPPDDDTYCQSKGFKPGSDLYVNCRRDRDHLISLQAEQGKRDLRKIQDYMMDNK